MRILGIDPGTAIVGWGVIESAGAHRSALSYGSIQPSKTTLTGRLESIYDDIQWLIKTNTPDIMSVEEVFFATNAKTAMSVGAARGVILLAATKSHIPVVSYSPVRIKLAVCGDGKADKKQVEKMIMLTLKLPSPPKPDDVTDALAIALTHSFIKI